MALIKCPECGGTVSDSAATCPHCGYQLIQKTATAVFKCADNGGWNTAWVKRTVELTDIISRRIIATFKMGEMVSIPIEKEMKVIIHVHGYMKRPEVELHPGQSVYVNITLKAGGAFGGGFCGANVIPM